TLRSRLELGADGHFRDVGRRDVHRLARLRVPARARGAMRPLEGQVPRDRQLLATLGNHLRHLVEEGGEHPVDVGLGHRGALSHGLHQVSTRHRGSPFAEACRGTPYGHAWVKRWMVRLATAENPRSVKYTVTRFSNVGSIRPLSGPNRPGLRRGRA